jgi:hypothetical protein
MSVWRKLGKSKNLTDGSGVMKIKGLIGAQSREKSSLKWASKQKWLIYLVERKMTVGEK